MSDDLQNDGKPNISVSVPIGALATLVVLGLATAGYLIATRGSEEDAVSDKPKSGRNVRRRLGLMTAITLIENDTTRKAVLALLRAMARRA
jgi:hypothetical protein